MKQFISQFLKAHGHVLDASPAQSLFYKGKCQKTYCYMSFYPFRRPMIYGAHFQIMLAYPESFFYAPKLPLTGKHIFYIFFLIRHVIHHSVYLFKGNSDAIILFKHGSCSSFAYGIGGLGRRRIFKSDSIGCFSWVFLKYIIGFPGSLVRFGQKIP